ncbi:MAG: hypothetical protein CMB80_16645 [Flammeovirgaceae bacterium]|nr:hypothetical protein [Flammeovirgaceae bacterium]|tara:strand:- start:804 stop:1301 length:498 start_codon:yes stop_codon:yes gene_type:complete
MKLTKQFLLILITILTYSCTDKSSKEPIQQPSLNETKAAILQTLNDETKAAFERNYDEWQSKWVHEQRVTKTYLDFSEDSFSESVGWQEINAFVVTFFEEHPDPEPVPELLSDIEVKIYGDGAWVIYEQQDSIRGLKRETRLMEKHGGEWKIAGMQTTIYGFQSE